MRRALLVGLDHYDDAHVQDLRGCVNDVLALAPLLERHENGKPNFATKLLTAKSEGDARTRVTRDELLAEMGELFAPGVDMSLLYFSGHGAPHKSADDVWLVASDAGAQTPGVRFTEILELIKNCDQPVIVILDCCFSGGAGGVPAVLTGTDVLRRGLTILAASRGDQTSVEAGGRGLFSLFLEDGLHGAAADLLGQVNVSGLYAYLSEAFGPWDQRPTFKASIDRLHTVREVEPQVKRSTLHKLPEWFPYADHQFPLDPTFEPDKSGNGLPPHPEHEAIFEELQSLRAANLLTPVGEKHMFYAAINSTACELTRVGKHYRDLAKRKLL